MNVGTLNSPPPPNTKCALHYPINHAPIAKQECPLLHSIAMENTTWKPLTFKLRMALKFERNTPGMGITRITLAFLAQKGFDPANWPEIMQDVWKRNFPIKNLVKH